MKNILLLFCMCSIIRHIHAQINPGIKPLTLLVAAFSSPLYASELTLMMNGAGIENVSGNTGKRSSISNESDLVNQSTVEETALVGYWKMDEGSGTSLVDASMYQNSGTLIGGVSWVSGKVGLGLDFNGRSAYATVPNKASLNPASAITLAAWINPQKLTTQYIIKKAVLNSTDGYELSLSNSGKIFFRINQETSGDNYRVNSTASYPTNGTTWMHVAATYDGSVMRLYINGVENASHATSNKVTIGTNSLVLGIGAQSNGNNKFDGVLDEVRIYNTALSANEITGLLEAPAIPGDTTPPVLQSINRYNPATPTTTAQQVTFRTTFSEKVRGVDVSDFSATIVSGSLQASVGAINAVDVDSTAYDVTVGSITGSGVFRLDLKASGTGITDTAGNAINGGYTSGQSYTIELAATGANIISYGATWKYLDNGSNQGTAWQSTSFDDASWKSGPAQLGYGEGDEATVVSYGSNSSSKYITTYFRKTVTFSNVNAYTVFSASVKRDDGVVVYVNGVEAYRNNMPTGTISYTTLASTAASDNGTTPKKFTINPAAFVNGTNVVAVELHQSSKTSSDISFDFEIIGTTNAPDSTQPVVVSITRQSPATQSTTAAQVTFRATFSEKVRGVDKTDFTATVVSGTLAATVGTVSTADSTAYDVTVGALSGSGVLRLDLKASGTGIVDTAANALTGGFATGESYVVNPSQNGFLTITQLNPVPISTSTGYKPQAKAWMYAGKHWAVLADGNGTFLWRLDGITWTNILKLSGRTSSKADCRVVGNITHILLFQGPSSQFVSLEYVPTLNTYQLWSKRTNTVGLTLDEGAETATIDLDGAGRMWLASEGTNQIAVRWSDAPYNNWSDPIVLDTTVTDDDICAVVYMPVAKKIGVFWSNQNTRFFGFKTHADGATPGTWSADERPASQSALNTIGGGMADDHMNLALTANGTLYAAVKTSYNTSGYPQISLLVRRPAGTWDNLYEVSGEGTRPIALINEEKGRIRLVYSSHEFGGDILYQESMLSTIAFGSPQLLIKGGTYDNTTSTHQNLRSEFAILSSDDNVAVGALASDGPSGVIPEVPTLDLPKNAASFNTANAVLSWNATVEKVSYQVQVSTSSGFSSIVFDQSGIAATSVSVSGLVGGKNYYWRVKASNSAGSSNWSSVWSFEKVPPSLVGYWKMDEGSGTTLVDASPYQNHGAIKGTPTWVAGKVSLGLQHNGSNEYTSVPNNASLSPTTAITLAAWIRPQRVATQYIIKKAILNATDGYELSLSNAGKVFFRINQETFGDAYRVNSVTSYPTNGATWMHVAATFDGRAMKLYINGVENASFTTDSIVAIKVNSLNLMIAAQSNGTNLFQGTLDQAMVYSEALNASEIAELAGVAPTQAITAAPSLMALPGEPRSAAPVREFTAYPNPFASQATVRIVLPESGDYLVSLYDVNGRQIAVLDQGQATAGSLQLVAIEGNKLGKGVYIVRLQTGKRNQTLKLLKME